MTGGPADLVEVRLGPAVRAAFTTAPTNVAHHAGDTSGTRAARRRLEHVLGAPVAFGTQVHRADVHVVGEVPAALPDDVGVADALVTVRDDVVLGVLVADCVPVLLADPGAGVVATIHAGRRGLVADVVGAAVAVMEGLGARVADIRAVVGPAACGRCYEVPAALRDEVGDVVPAAVSTTAWGTAALDLPRGVGEQLRSRGVVHVRQLGACTVEDDTWFSHRGATGGARPHGAPRHRPQGRFAGVVRLAPACRA